VLRPRGLAARIVLAVAVLVAALQAVAFLIVSRANQENARDRVAEELVVGELAFVQALAAQRQHLAAAAALLAADPLLREAASHPRRTQEHLAARLALTGAHLAQVVDAGGVRAAAGAVDPRVRLASDELLAQAQRAGSAAAVAIAGGRPYELALAPIAGGGAVVLALAYDDRLARRMRELTTFETRLLLAGDGPLRALGASQPQADDGALANALRAQPAGVDRVVHLQSSGNAYRAMTVAQVGELRVLAAIGRPLADAAPVFDRLRTLLLLVAAASVALALLAGLLIAHALMRPLRRLTEAAQRIRDGDYRAPIAIAGSDEIGLLAASLNHMRQSIAERDERNRKLAFSDTLTGLPNRTRLTDSIRNAIDQACAERGLQMPEQAPAGHGRAAVMLLDLDRFKQINDTLGHRVGDAVLRIVARRINQTVRPADTVARLGGDEFALALPRSDAALAKTVARDLTQVLRAPIECDELNQELARLNETPIEYDSSIDVGASIGIAIHPEHGGDDQALLRRADIAMYAAKRNHVAWALFDTRHEVARLEHLSLLSELRRAVEESQLRAYYQPKIEIASGRVLGVEALVRWRHPERGLLAPAEFMPYAEQTGYVRVITRWMLAVTLRQCGAWAAAGTPLEVAVNLSARDLARTDLVRAVAELLQAHQVPPQLVCLEITESTFMQNPELALGVLHGLHALGVHLSIDDFGTGFSSLAYMKRLPVHELKIDSTFVQGMASGVKDVAIVRSTIELAHNLGLRVVAEGVEDERCLARLRELGCDIAQGYLLGRPMRRSAFENWQRTHDRAGAGAAALVN